MPPRTEEVRTLGGEVRGINSQLTAAKANRMMLAFKAADALRRAGLP